MVKIVSYKAYNDYLMVEFLNGLEVRRTWMHPQL